MSKVKRMTPEERLKDAEKRAQELRKKVEEDTSLSDESDLPLNYGNLLIGSDIRHESVNVFQLDDAPHEWNRYSVLTGEEFSGLMESIVEIGLQQPIVVWEQPSGRFMILAGHNRSRAFRALYELTGSKEYLKIPAMIRKEKEIDALTAEQIVIDTNDKQRNKTVLEKNHAIIFRYKKLAKMKKENIDLNKLNIAKIIAEQMGMSRRTVFNYVALKDLIPEFIDVLGRNQITMKQALLLAKLPEKDQASFFEEYGASINKSFLTGLDFSRDYNTLRECIKERERQAFEKSRYTILKLDVPVELKEEIRKMVDNFIQGRRNPSS